MTIYNLSKITDPLTFIIIWKANRDNDLDPLYCGRIMDAPIYIARMKLAFDHDNEPICISKDLGDKYGNRAGLIITVEDK